MQTINLELNVVLVKQAGKIKVDSPTVTKNISLVYPGVGSGAAVTSSPHTNSMGLSAVRMPLELGRFLADSSFFELSNAR